jgi:hypothetical protein
VSIFTKRNVDGAEKQREDRDVIVASLAARSAEPTPWAAGQPPALSSEETEALSKARYAASMALRRDREEIAALRDQRSQVQGIGSEAEQARDAALAARDLEAAITAQIRISAAHDLVAYIDQLGERRFAGSWRSGN